MSDTASSSSSEEKVPEYKVGKKVALKDLLAADSEDESLRKYKESLLGAATGGPSSSEDPRRVVIKEMRVLFEDRPGGDIVYTLESAEELKKMKETPFTLKEGCSYKIRVVFKVQHEIVSGLKHVNFVYRKGVRVGKDDSMLGSFGPQPKPHEVTFPRIGWEEAPSGLLARGSYTAKTQFIDDDGEVHLEYEYAFAIKKDWAGSD